VIREECAPGRPGSSLKFNWLNQYGVLSRDNAVYALIQINSPRARAVLRDYAARVQNAEVREFIHNRLEAEERENHQLQ
jgi:hypothetical protein